MAQFVDEFDRIGSKVISEVKGVNRNFKLNLVSDGFFSKGLPDVDFEDPDWHQKYRESSLVKTSRTRDALNLLQIAETRDVFGLTYRDLVEMDELDFNYVMDKIYKISEQRVKNQKLQESKEQ